MSAWDLPTTLEVNGAEYEIRTDYRAVLDLMTVLEDVELSDSERAMIALEVLYIEFDAMPPSDYQEACRKLMWFVGGGDSPAKAPKRKLVDWQQDWPLIIGPVNRVLGYEARTAQVHWWTFLAAYCEIGDCTFAQVVGIRNKKAKGRKLEKHEQEFYKAHRELVDFKTVLTDEDMELLDKWAGRSKDG